MSLRERELAEQLANAERDGERFCQRIAALEAIVHKSTNALVGYECWCRKPSTDFPCERCIALAFIEKAGFEVELSELSDPISASAIQFAAAKEGAGR